MKADSKSVVLKLASGLERRLVAEGVHGVTLLPLDRDREGRYRAGAGLEIGREKLLRSHYRLQPMPALLFMGMHPASAASVRRPEVAALLDWPGVVQLPYGATWNEISSAAQRAAKGARAPLPRSLLAPVEDLLRLTSEVRHWLRNRLRNTEGAVSIFERAVRGEIRLHSSTLRPVASISSEHIEMLERLWSRAKPGLDLAPHCGGVGGIQAALDMFTRQWEEIEAARAALREGGERTGGAVEPILRKHEAACQALRDAIAASEVLDDELRASRED